MVLGGDSHLHFIPSLAEGPSRYLCRQSPTPSSPSADGQPSAGSHPGSPRASASYCGALGNPFTYSQRKGEWEFVPDFFSSTINCCGLSCCHQKLPRTRQIPDSIVTQAPNSRGCIEISHLLSLHPLLHHAGRTKGSLQGPRQKSMHLSEELLVFPSLGNLQSLNHSLECSFMFI